MIQRVITDMGGLEILVNLLETNELKCQHGSLAALLQISSSYEMRHTLTDLGIVTPLIQLLRHPARDLQVLTVETMANIALVRKARKQIRKRGGIPLLVSYHRLTSDASIINDSTLSAAGRDGRA